MTGKRNEELKTAEQTADDAAVALWRALYGEIKPSIGNVATEQLGDMIREVMTTARNAGYAQAKSIYRAGR